MTEQIDRFDVLTGPAPVPPSFLIGQAASASDVSAYRGLRRAAFVDSLGLFDHDDADGHDSEQDTVVLVARTRDGVVCGGVRLHPVAGTSADLGWWHGGRLVVAPGAPAGVGTALVRSACAHAEAAGVLRFEATVLATNGPMFAHLGWRSLGPVTVGGAPHVRMRWEVDRVAQLVAATKAALGSLLDGVRPGGAGFVGDDCAPVPGSTAVASVDAILPSMVDRDPEWAGWCGVLVGAADLAAVGASFSGVLDALGARDAAHAARVLTGLKRASEAFRLPVLGGHTQLGVPAALSVTALGVADRPVPGGGGLPGHDIRLTVDLGGGWRPGYTGRQWDSTSSRTAAELDAMFSVIRRAQPAAAKDVSMAGLAGTLGMLAEASGCAAELDAAAIPRPAGVSLGDWATCFPGTGLLSTSFSPGFPSAGPAASAVCGRLTAGRGVTLRWPDGESTQLLTGRVTGLGPA